MRLHKNQQGLTIVELLVVIAIIGIMAGVVIGNLNQSTAQSRDAERKADIRNVESALELYKLKYGRYPEACNGPTTNRTTDLNNWSGQLGTDHECANGTGQYIVGDLSTTPGTESFREFLRVLPADPKLNGTDSGYVYAVDQNGETFKFMALNTVETQVIEPGDTFSRCGLTNDAAYECTATPNDQFGSGESVMTGCSSFGTPYENDFAVRGGFASYSDPVAQEYFSEIVRCK